MDTLINLGIGILGLYLIGGIVGLILTIVVAVMIIKNFKKFWKNAWH